MENLEKRSSEFLVLSEKNVINRREELRTEARVLLKAAEEGLVLREYLINEIIRLRMLLGNNLNTIDEQVGEYLTSTSSSDLLCIHKQCIDALAEKFKNQISDFGMKK